MANDAITYAKLCKELRSDLKKGKIEIESLGNMIDTLFEPMMKILLKAETSVSAYEDFIYLCMDYYTFTDSLLISDYDYDQIMNMFLRKGGYHISTADNIAGNDVGTKWNIVKHEEPGVVGTVSKVYSKEELDFYWRKYPWCHDWIVGPKYDGISSSIKIENGKIVLACTRYDGIYGQDITLIVKNAKNASTFMEYFDQDDIDGFYKVELCVGMSDYQELIKEKYYANRRSATSGIINSPKNLEYAHYITIIPLAKYVPKHNGDRLIYRPLLSRVIEGIGSSDYLYNKIKEMLNVCRDPEFEFRTDGVVIMPTGLLDLDKSDLMSNAIAFKVNTKIGTTRIKRLYVSVGRLGKAVPMAEVIPVEVNETIVSDVSLGSFDKMVGLNLHEDETVEIYSAGDVIPQLRLPEEKTYPKNSPYIYLKLNCPYCGEKLDRIGREMFCNNPKCVRVKTGKIANFVSKIGMENISDATIEDLYMAKLIKHIPDIFSLRYEDIRTLEGYGDISAQNIIYEIDKIKEKAIPLDQLFGALGIPDIAEKTARKIFSVISLDDLFKKKEKIFMKLITAEGIGEATAKSFVNFIKDNEEDISELLDILNVTEPIKWKGNVVFTGFRNTELQEEFNKIGYEVSDNVNSKTVAVITNSRDSNSTKCRAAMKKGIDIIHLLDVDDLIKSLKKKIK